MQRPRVLIIDDNPLTADELLRRLEPLHYTVEVAHDGSRGLERLKNVPFDLVLLDVVMPGLDGYEVCRQIKGELGLPFIPVIMVTSLESVQHKVKGLEAGADDFLSWPFEQPELAARTRSLLRLKQLHDHLERTVDARTRELKEAFERLQQLNEELLLAEEETILRLARAAESRDGETANHLVRMSLYSERIARQLGLSDDFARRIRLAPMKHDVGKIGIPDRLLRNPGAFTSEERQEMMVHPTLGAEILAGSRSQLLQMGERIALTHHEWYDGTGYPQSLRGEEIPIEGRIVSLADFFDAVASRRRYKDPVATDQVFEMIRARSGTHFDPTVVKAFFAAREEILAIQRRYEDEGRSDETATAASSEDRHRRGEDGHGAKGRRPGGGAGW